MAQNKELNVLAWYDSLHKQNHRKWWTFDKVFALITAVDQLPPFQKVRSQTGASVTELKLINFSTNAETDILLQAQLAGLEVATFDDYDLIIYPSILPLEIPNITVGLYYLQMSDGTNTWYSDIFNMSDCLEDMIKIEYWHNDDFEYPGGHIRYQYPFKNRIYVNSDIGKPSVEYAERVKKKEGKNHALQQICYNLNRFVMLAPEYLIHALRVIRMHDQVEIRYDGYEYDVDEILMKSPKWEDEGDVAEIEFEFHTDTIVVVNGRAADNVEYGLTAGNCIVVNYRALATLAHDSAEYTNNYWLDDAVQVPFVANDYLLKTAANDEITLEQFDGTDYQPVVNVDYDSVYDVRGDSYKFFYQNSFTSPLIESYQDASGNKRIIGKSLNTRVDIYSRNASDVEILIASGTFTQLTTIGIPYELPEDAVQVKIKNRSVACDQIEESEWFDLEGVGFNEIENDFVID